MRQLAVRLKASALTGHLWGSPGGAALFDAIATEALDRVLAALLLGLFFPLIVVLAIAIRLDSPGPALYRCRRIGLRGREFAMLKFRKMHVGASGLALTAADDERFTRLGRALAKSKLDELPQLWNVLCGQMSLVGPRPEDSSFVELQERAYQFICRVKPGITGLSQLAFARESEILDPQDRVGDYVRRVLPQKIHLDQLYARRRSIGMDLRILYWTALVVVMRREVAVHRDSGGLSRRRRTVTEAVSEAVSEAATG